ncbi:hypothetical protein NQD34_009557 [Periophthalmus magnuspinnatus]|nr:hypothetical protein NQD34_009557 [Periophthalmus magnuspinnatus]
MQKIKYANDYWYLTNDIQNQGWDTLVADQDNTWTPTQAKTDWAGRQAELLTLAKTESNLLVTINNIKKNLTNNGQECWIFLLRAHVSGIDRIYKLIICEMLQTPEPVLSPRLQSSGIKIKATVTFTKEQVFNMATGVSDFGNNWLTMIEQASKYFNKDCVACMGPRPLLRMVPTPPELTVQCVEDIFTKTAPEALTKPEKQKPIFEAKLPKGNYTCIQRSNSVTNVLGNIDGNLCEKNLTTNKALPSDSDIYWYCGGKILRANMPNEFSGVCALVNLIIPIEVMSIEQEQLTALIEQQSTENHAIGVPRGVPDKYKLANQIATGFENIPLIAAIIPITPNKNVDRINYIHYKNWETTHRRGLKQCTSN